MHSTPTLFRFSDTVKSEIYPHALVWGLSNELRTFALTALFYDAPLTFGRPPNLKMPADPRTTVL